MVPDFKTVHWKETGIKIVKDPSHWGSGLHTCIGQPREYWMIYRGPGFIAVVWFGSSPNPSPSRPRPPSVSCLVSLSQSSCISPVELTDGRGGRGGGGAKSNDDEKAWSPINHSIFSAAYPTFIFRLKENRTGIQDRLYHVDPVLVYCTVTLTPQYPPFPLQLSSADTHTEPYTFTSFSKLTQGGGHGQSISRLYPTSTANKYADLHTHYTVHSLWWGVIYKGV